MNIASLPKAELHCHLDGVLDRAMLHQIREADPTFPIDPAVFEQAYPVHNFDTFLRWWQFCQPIHGQLPRYYPILRAHIELCPTSNLKTGSIASLSVHPIGQAAALGLSFSINTDDPVIFENSMSLKYQRLADTFDFGEAYFQRVFQQSLEARFRSM